MVETQAPQRSTAGAGNALRVQLERLRAENARLREENRRLRTALDAHIARVSATSLFGPLELTAGTCLGPRRQRGEVPTPGDPQERR